MKIRKGKPKDFKKVALIMKKEFFKAPYHEFWTMNNAIKTIKGYAKLGDIYIAEESDKIVGFIIFREENYNTGKQIMIEELVVLKELQGRGIGKALVMQVERYCKRSKIKTIHLSTSKRAPAFGFYKHLGYIPSKYTVFLRKKLK